MVRCFRSLPFHNALDRVFYQGCKDQGKERIAINIKLLFLFLGLLIIGNVYADSGIVGNETHDGFNVIWIKQKESISDFSYIVNITNLDNKVKLVDLSYVISNISYSLKAGNKTIYPNPYPFVRKDALYEIRNNSKKFITPKHHEKLNKHTLDYVFEFDKKETKTFYVTAALPISNRGNGYGASAKIAIWINGIEYHPWAYSEWSYRDFLTFVNTTTSKTVIRVKYDTFTPIFINQRMRPDCFDLRITDTGDSEREYYVVGGCGTKNTTIDIEVLNNTNQLYFYYGNYNASNVSNVSTVYTSTTTSNISGGYYLLSLSRTSTYSSYIARLRFSTTEAINSENLDVNCYGINITDNQTNRLNYNLNSSTCNNANTELDIDIPSNTSQIRIYINATGVTNISNLSVIFNSSKIIVSNTYKTTTNWNMGTESNYYNSTENMTGYNITNGLSFRLRNVTANDNVAGRYCRTCGTAFYFKFNYSMDGALLNVNQIQFLYNNRDEGSLFSEQIRIGGEGVSYERKIRVTFDNGSVGAVCNSYPSDEAFISSNIVPDWEHDGISPVSTVVLNIAQINNTHHNCSIWINGKLDSWKMGNSTAIPPHGGQFSPMSIGNQNGDFELNGTIYEVIIFNRSLFETEIKELHNRTSPFQKSPNMPNISLFIDFYPTFPKYNLTIAGGNLTNVTTDTSYFGSNYTIQTEAVNEIEASYDEFKHIQSFNWSKSQEYMAHAIVIDLDAAGVSYNYSVLGYDIWTPKLPFMNYRENNFTVLTDTFKVNGSVKRESATSVKWDICIYRLIPDNHEVKCYKEYSFFSTMSPQLKYGTTQYLPEIGRVSFDIPFLSGKTTAFGGIDLNSLILGLTPAITSPTNMTGFRLALPQRVYFESNQPDNNAKIYYAPVVYLQGVETARGGTNLEMLDAEAEGRDVKNTGILTTLWNWANQALGLLNGMLNFIFYLITHLWVIILVAELLIMIFATRETDSVSSFASKYIGYHAQAVKYAVDIIVAVTSAVITILYQIWDATTKWL